MEKLSDSSKAKIYTGLCIFSWAFIPVVAKLGQIDLDNHQFLFWTSLISFITLFSVTLLSGKIGHFKEYDKKAILNAVFLGFLGAYLYYIFLYFGYAQAKGLEVLILQYTWPIFVVIFAYFFINEKLTLSRIIALMFGFVGILIILTKGDIFSISFDKIKINLIVLIGASFYAIFSVLGKKANYEQFTMVTIFFFTATIASFFSMIIFSDFKTLTIDSLFPVFLNGIFINGISYVFWFKALKYGKVSSVAQAVFFVPILSSVFLLLIFNERFLLIYLVGFIFILLSNLLVQNKDKIKNIAVEE